MGVTHVTRNKGATIVVKAKAEILMYPGGSVHRWTKNLEGRIQKFTAAAAPVNTKRPHWDRDGIRLKDSIVASALKMKVRGQDRHRLYAGVGSTKQYSAFVDQGTGPHMATLLPPWHRGSPTLYEASWAPPFNKGTKLGPIAVSGQEAKYFFNDGINAAMANISRYPGALSKIAKLGPSLGAPDFYPDFIIDQEDNRTGELFLKDREDWRRWRDEAFFAESKTGKAVPFARTDRTRLKDVNGKTVRVPYITRKEAEGFKRRRELQLNRRTTKRDQAKAATKARKKANLTPYRQRAVQRAQEFRLRQREAAQRTLDQENKIKNARRRKGTLGD